MDKDCRNIYSRYILRESQLLESSYEDMSLEDLRDLLSNPANLSPGDLDAIQDAITLKSKPNPIGHGTVLRPAKKPDAPRNAAIDSVLNTDPPADQEAIDHRRPSRAVDVLKSIKPSPRTRAPSRGSRGHTTTPAVQPIPAPPVADSKSTKPTVPDARPRSTPSIQTKPVPAPPVQTKPVPEPSFYGGKRGDPGTLPPELQAKLDRQSPTRPDAAELAQMNKDTELAKPMPQNWRNAHWSRKSRMMSGNLASNARLKKAAQDEWDKRESRRLGQAPVKKRNSFGDWFKSLAPGGAKPSDSIPGRVKTK